MADHPILFKPEMVCALLDGRKTQTRRIFKPRGFEFYTHPISGDRYNEYRPYRDGSWDESRISGSGSMRAFGWGECLYAYLPHAPGDRFWVKETWRPHSLGETSWNVEFAYAADGYRTIIYDGEFGLGDNDWNWPKAADSGNVSPLFMPRWASRITLTVTDVRVQRIQDIRTQDAIAEGIVRDFSGPVAGWSGVSGVVRGDARSAFRDLWDSINAKPRPVKWSDGKVSFYVSYPWDGEPRTETYRGKPHYIHPNPWVAAYTFDVIKGNIDRIGGAA